jgi:hypothetical protein
MKKKFTEISTICVRRGKNTEKEDISKLFQYQNNGFSNPKRQNL